MSVPADPSRGPSPAHPDDPAPPAAPDTPPTDPHLASADPNTPHAGLSAGAQPGPPPSPAWPAVGQDRIPGVGARRRRHWWLITASIVWAVLLAGLGALSARRDPPSVPDQVELPAAVPAVERATGAVLAALDDDAVLAIGPLVIDRECRITSVRPGAEATRDVTVYLAPGEGPAALEAIAAGLPPAYGAQVSRSRSGTRHALYGDAGDFIAVRGTVDTAAGPLTVRSSTGCRPGPDGVTSTEPAAGQLPAALTAALNALELSATGTPTAHEVRCPGGGLARTVAVHGTPTTVDLAAALKPATVGATVVEAGPDRYAYRSGDASIVVANSAGQTRLTATTTTC